MTEAIAIVRGRLIDGTGASPTPDVNVIVAGPRIAAVGPRIFSVGPTLDLDTLRRPAHVLVDGRVEVGDHEVRLAPPHSGVADAG